MRIANRVIIVLLALALLALGVWGLAEAVAEATGHAPVLADPTTIVDALAGQAWSDPPVVGAAAVVLVVGLVLLAFQLKPRRPQDYPVAPGSDPTGQRRHLTWERHGLARLAAQVARTQPEVVDVAGSRLLRRTLRLDTRCYAQSDPERVRRDVTAAVRTALDELGLARPPQVRVAVSPSDRRTR